MKVVSFWERVASPVDLGEGGFAPSITQPDLAYDIRQLVEDYSVDALPPMALLQPLFDDDDDNAPDEDYMHALRGADKADRSLLALQNSKLRDSIIDKVKRMHEFRKERDEYLKNLQKSEPSSGSESPES